MTGSIPPYGKNFERVSVDEWHSELSRTVYVLEQDQRWFIRSDQTSHVWYIYHGPTIAKAIRVGTPCPTLTLAMDRLLAGIAGGFYATGEAAAAPPRAGITRCPACGLNLVSYL